MNFNKEFKNYLKTKNLSKEQFILDSIDVYELKSINSLIRNIYQLYSNGLTLNQMRQIHILREYLESISKNIN